MSAVIPVHIQRVFEQRWAARLIPSVALISPKYRVSKLAAATSRRKPKKKAAGNQELGFKVMNQSR
jgi:hypothetical protein